MGDDRCEFCVAPMNNPVGHAILCWGLHARRYREEATALRAEVERMKGAANRFAEGRISAGKLAEELGVEDKHGFKNYARSFDEEWDLLSAAKAEVERLRERLDQYEAYAISVASALDDRAEVARLRAALEEIEAWLSVYEGPGRGMRLKARAALEEGRARHG